MSAVPPTRQGRQQRLPPPGKRPLNMQALQAAICLSPLLLRHWARSILQLASSWMILAKRFLACQARLERQAFCANAFQYWYSVLMLSYYVTVCRCGPSTPRTDCRTHFAHLVLIFKLPREYIYRGSKKIIIIIHTAQVRCAKELKSAVGSRKAVCRLCLHILTAEMIKILNNSPSADYWSCFIVGEGVSDIFGGIFSPR